MYSKSDVIVSTSDVNLSLSLINLYKTCLFANVSANETFNIISSLKDFFFVDSSSKSFSFSMIFFNRFLTFLRVHFTVVLIEEFVSRIFSIFFIISSFDFHSVERSSSIK
jgi:hypothetical protein